MVKVYFIRTEATEDEPAYTCAYNYRQFKEVCERLTEAGIKYETWVDYIEED